MTVRVTALRGGGLSIEAYFDRNCQAEQNVTMYYHPSPEGEVDEPGRWWGRQADELELTGHLHGDSFRRLLDGQHPSANRRLGRCYSERSVRGYDVTFNAPKSVSLLYAFGDGQVRRQVHAAHDAAVEAVLRFVEQQAHTRVSVDGVVCVVDAHGIAAAIFRQHTSRAEDPHLHSHAVVIAKVRDPRGGWRALDGRMIKHDQRTLSALYHAGLRAELTRRLGVAWRTPLNGIAELDGIDQHVLAGFSKRSGQAAHRLEVKLDRFLHTIGRQPNLREHWRLAREAAADSRPVKHRTRTLGELTRRWERELADHGLTPDQLVHNAIGRNLQPTGITVDQATRMLRTAIGELDTTSSTWRPNDLLRELARHVATTTGVDADHLASWLERTTSRELSRHLQLAPVVPVLTTRRSDGRPITESTLDHRFTTHTVWRQETAIHDWAQRRLAMGGARRRVFPADGMDRAQVAAARSVAGTQPLVVVVGPAGAGKTTMLRAAAQQLRRDQRAVFGLTPSATAAGVLAAETGITSDTVDKLLHEHTRPNGPGAGYALPAGATVIVDEAGMLATPKLASVAELADRHHWRVVLVGDVRQLPAVGRGGMFTHLCALTEPVELERIHRFHQTWERSASLALRAGDPQVLDDYHHHQRLHAGSREQMVSEILDHWQRHRRDGQSVVMLAPGNDTVDELNRRAQQARLDAGHLDSHRAARTSHGTKLYVGDMVVTRENNRDLRTDRGVMIRNRATWTITEVAPGGITVHGTDGTITLPGDYTRRAVELGYAQTIHGAQGRTVDHSLLLADTSLDGRGLYVAMTRGRQSNHVYVAPQPGQDPREVLEHAVAADWADRPALDTHTELHRPQPQPRHVDSRLGRLEPLPTRQLVAVWRERQQLAQLGSDRHHTALQNAEKGLAVEQHRARSLHHDVARIQHELVAATGARAELPRLGHGRQRAALDHRIDQLHAQLNHTRAALGTSVASLPRMEAHVLDERSWLQQHQHVPGRINQLDRTLRLDAHARAQQAIAIDPATLDRLGGGRTALELGLNLQLRTISQTMAPVQPPTPQRSRSPRLEGPELGLGL